jgi:hypothetical protein
MSHPPPYGAHPSVHTQIVTQPHRSSTAHLVIAWVVTVLSVGYTLPWAIAATRNKTNTASVAAVNILLGWSVIGWVVALVMSLTSEPQPTIYLNTAVFTQPQVPYGPPAGAAALPPRGQAPYALPPHAAGHQPPTWSAGYQQDEPTAILPPYQTGSWGRPDPDLPPPTYR